MDSSLVGSQMSNDASSDQSLVYDGAGYDEVFGSGQKSNVFSELSGKETSTQSPSDDVEDYVERVGEKVLGEVEEEWEGDRDEEEDDGDEESYKEVSVSPGGNHPFILLED